MMLGCYILVLHYEKMTFIQIWEPPLEISFLLHRRVCVSVMEGRINKRLETLG